MVFSKNSTLKALTSKAKKFGTVSDLFGGFIDPEDRFVHPKDRVRIVYLSDDLNEPEDLSFYSDRFASQCSKEVREEIWKETGHYIYHFLTWEKKDNATKAIQCYCLSSGMMRGSDKVVVTSIIGLVNASSGEDYYYITYRIEKA